MAEKKTLSPTYRKIYLAIKKIPRGKVATYGQIARIAGMPNQARLVGYALHALRGEYDQVTPWYRVINARGESSLGEDGRNLQRELLELEGVGFDLRGRVDLEKFGWKK